MALSYKTKFDIFGLNTPKNQSSILNPTKTATPKLPSSSPFSLFAGTPRMSYGDYTGKKQSTIGKTVNTPATEFPANQNRIAMSASVPSTTPIATTPAATPTATPTAPAPASVSDKAGKTEFEPVYLSEGNMSPDYEYKITYDDKGNVISKTMVEKAKATADTDTSLEAPTFLTTLPEENKAIIEAQRTSEIQALQAEMKEKEKQQVNASKAFLAKTGALGRTVSGAPVDTGLGIASTVKKSIDDEYSQKVAQINAKYAGLESDTLNALNSQKQQEWENKLAITPTASSAYEKVSAGETIVDPITGRVIYQAPAETTTSPIKLGAGETLYDPVSGKALFTAPAKPSDNKPVTEKTADGSVIQWNPETESWSTISVGGMTPYQQEQLALDWTKYQQGQQPDAEKQAKLEFAQQNKDSVIALANELLNDPNLPFAVGASAAFVNPLTSSGAYTTQRTIKQLIDTIASTNLDKMKGAMSDKDIEFLRQIGTKLNKYMNIDDFKKELNKIIQNQYEFTTSSTGGGFDDVDWDNINIAEF